MLSLDLNKYVRVAVWGIIGWTTMLGMYSAYHNRVWKRYLHEGKRDYENQWKMGAQIASIVQDGETVFIPHGGICYLYYTANLYPSCMAEIGYGVGPMEVDIEHAAEFYNLNASQGYKLYKLLHDSRIKRRELKDELEKINLSLGTSIRSANMENLERSIIGLEHRQYTPRINKELFGV